MAHDVLDNIPLDVQIAYLKHQITSLQSEYASIQQNPRHWSPFFADKDAHLEAIAAHIAQHQAKLTALT